MAKKSKTAAQILIQLRKDGRATMRGLTALDEADRLDLVPNDFSIGIYLSQLNRLLYATPPATRPKKIQNALTALSKKIDRKAKCVTPEKLKSLCALKLEVDHWEHALSGKKLTTTRFVEYCVWSEWKQEHGEPPSLREMQTASYKASLKTIRNRLSEARENPNKKISRT